MKNAIITIVVSILVGGVAFYGGMLYAKNQTGTNFGGPMGQRNGNFSANSVGNKQPGMNGFNGINGEIISKDDSSLTVKLRDGGSKIVFFSDSTTVSKMTSGTIADLQIGENVMVNGETNSDGSVTAKSIDLRPMINNQSSSVTK